MGKTISAKTIMSLAKKHGSDPFTALDEALIAMAGLGYFSANELSLIKVSDLISERGEACTDGFLPSELNANGRSRYFFIGKSTYLMDCLDRYIDHRLASDLGLLDRGLYRGLDPNTKLFLKDDGMPFSVHYKQRYEGDTVTQALQVQRQFKKYYLGEGVTLGTLMDSFIVNFWNAKSPQGNAQAITDLMQLTCLTADTLKKKCAKQQESIEEILVNLYK